jgi:hypothetical protein
VVACPAVAPGVCEEIFCGGRLWQNGTDNATALITYRILDPQGQFPDSYKTAIRDAATAWANATSNVVRFRECAGCFGRFVSVVPGDGDGIVDPTAFEQILPMPADQASLANVPLHRIAHQWGHLIGLGHTYERADRDRYVRFDPNVWCAASRPGLPPRCAFGPAELGGPRVSSDTFGAYDEMSKMNGFASDGICGAAEPDANSAQPTEGDAAAVQELYYSHTSAWAPFRPLGRSVDATQPLDYQLAQGIDPTGTPAIAEWRSAMVEIFVRGTDGKVYGTRNELNGTTFVRWSDWAVVATGVDADPSATFADADTLYLAVRSRADGAVRLLTRTRGVWGPPVSLGAPAAGAASAPAVAGRVGPLVGVLVLGGDGLVYARLCTDPQTTMCSGRGWTPLPASPPRFISKPMAVWSDTVWLMVTAVAEDNDGWVIGGNDGGFDGSYWQRLPIDLMDADPNPGVAIQVYAGELGFHGRNARRAHAESTSSGSLPPLGGVLTAAPGVVSPREGDLRIDVAAVIEDHGHPGVWWKFWGGFTPPCNYNVPGTCAQCGCNLPDTPSCNL